MSSTPPDLPPETRAAIAAAQAQARAALNAGDRAGAIGAYRQIVALAPHLADYWFDLGYHLRLERQPEAALHAYQAALEHGAAGPEEIHLNRAVILSDDLLRDADAETELRAALRLAPDYAPARLNLGNLLEDRGDAAGAAREYEALFGNPAARSELAAQALSRHLRTAPPEASDDPRLERLEQLAQTKGLTAETRAACQFERGQALEALGDHAAAFDAYRHANACVQAGRPAYNAERAQAAADAIVSSFGALHSQTEPDRDGPAPIFICGLHRSGSTLLEQILAQHPELAPGGEIDWFPQLAARAIQPFPQAAAKLTGSQRARWRQDYLAHLAQLRPDDAAAGRRITDKRPENFLLIGLILFVFPNARILHTLRDPRDVAVSLYSQHLDPRGAPHACAPSSIASHLALHRTMMDRWRAMHPGAILDVSYEALVAAPEAEIARVLEFLALDPAEGLLDFHRARNAVKTASAWQVRRPLNSGSIGRWKRFREPLAAMFEQIEASGLV